MDSEISSWLINPQNVFNDNIKTNSRNDDSFQPPNFMQGVNDESFLNTSNNASGFDLQGFSKPLEFQDSAKGNLNPTMDNNFDLQYSDIDNLLTQELKDLDIPMAPSPSGNEFDWRQKNIITTPQQVGLQHSKKPSMAHKRGMSGTAIFGFANHNKTLSISSIQKTIRDISKDPNLNSIINNYNSNSPESMEISNYNTFSANPVDIIKNNKNSNSTNEQLSQMILNQQETLRLELEKQKEMNKKLELQLRENQLQQEKLQQVLHEQEVTTQQQQQLNKGMSSNSGSPLRSQIVPQMIRTPAKSQRGHGEDDPLIVTSNSAMGTYQFPPPQSSATSQQMLSSPTLSNNIINGSPSKGYSVGRTRKGLIPNLQLEDGEDFVRSSSGIPSAPPAPVFNTFKSPSRSPNNDNNIRDKFGSPEYFGGMKSRDRDMTPFTPPSMNGSTEGRLHTKKESVLSSASTIPQQEAYDNRSKNNSNNGLLGLGISMPTIPGSKETTPVKCKLPQKHTFQHTPVKKGVETSNGSPLAKQMAIPMIERTPEVYTRLPDPVEFTPSPKKITKKPTTLPPGSIDKYVKELPEKLFQCLYPGCGKAFKRRYNVRSHIQTHLQDRPYQCDYDGCGKAFVRNHDLVRHKRTHEAKIYGCPCGKRFSKESSLLNHRGKMICSGGKKFDTCITKSSSPSKRYDYDENNVNSNYGAEHQSPVKTNIERDKRGYVLAKMDEQLSKDIEKYGLLNPPQEVISRSTPTKMRAMAGNMFVTTPPSSFSDLESP